MDGIDGPAPKVLVVEDEVDLGRAIVSWLETDCPVRFAADGRTALDRYDETVDVVLLDRRLPRLSGDEVLSRIRAAPGECRVAMVTAVEPEMDIVDLPFDDYVVKPIDRTVVRSLVTRLHRRATYDEKIAEQFAILDTIATLEAHHDAETLATSDEYARLQAELADIEVALDETAGEFTHHDFAALLARDTQPSPPPRPAD